LLSQKYLNNAKKRAIAKPFLNWAGGKTQLLEEIVKRLPPQLLDGQIDTYIEPFLGGGAVFFHIAQNYPVIKKFYLCDINYDLINCYKTVQTDVQSLIECLNVLEGKFLSLNENSRKDFYLQVRGEFNLTKHKGNIKSAAKLIFLNKTCFNGLFRVNSKNEFNVPFGGYKKPTICDKENLLAVSEVLHRAKIFCCDFTKSLRYIDKNTFVYLDPPYRPLSATAGFTSYSKDSFSEADQIRLAKFCKEIKHIGAKFILSNSDPKNEDPDDIFFEKHYPKKEVFYIDTVKASRVINCKPTQRGRIDELLIRNY
jgi:DNA adenine methylase